MASNEDDVQQESGKRQMLPGVFVQVPGHHVGGWRHPDAVTTDWPNPVRDQPFARPPAPAAEGPSALALLEQAQPILRSLPRMLSPRRHFDPARSRRVFRLAAPDFVLTLFTELLSRLRADAPGVAIE